MPEELTADPGVDLGHTTEGLAAEATEESEFGMGYNEPDTPLGDPGDTEGHTEDGSQEGSEDPKATTDVPEDPVERERGYLRQDDYSRKTAELAEERRRLQAEREAERQQLQQERQMYQQQAAQYAQPDTPTQSEIAERLQRLQPLLQNPDLSPMDREGISFFADGFRITDQKLQATEQETMALRQQVEQLTEFVQRTAQDVQGATEAHRAQTQAQIKSEADEARELFGQAALTEHTEFVVRNHGKELDPSTGQPFTVAQLLSFRLQQVAQAQQAAQGQQREARGRAKQAARGAGTTQAPAANNGFLSEAQAKELIRSTI